MSYTEKSQLILHLFHLYTSVTCDLTVDIANNYSTSMVGEGMEQEAVKFPGQK